MVPHGHQGQDVVIDCHGHLVPPSLTKMLLGGPVPGIGVSAENVEENAVVFDIPGEGRARPMPGALSDLDGIRDWAREAGVDRQVVSTWSDLFAYGLDPSSGAAWHRLMNEELLAACQGAEEWLPLASVPLQDGERAAGEVEWASSEGFSGITIAPSTPERELDDPGLTPFWDAVAATKLPVLLHPLLPASNSRLKGYSLPNTIGRPIETTIAVARLLCGGVLEQRRGITLVLAHGGGALPYLWGRLWRNFVLERERAGDWGVSGTEISDIAAGRSSLYFDSVVNDSEALGFLLRFAGADRVLLGSDYPFAIGDHEPLTTLDSVEGLEAGARRRVVHDNAASVFIASGRASQ